MNRHGGERIEKEREDWREKRKMVEGKLGREEIKKSNTLSMNIIK